MRSDVIKAMVEMRIGFTWRVREKAGIYLVNYFKSESQVNNLYFSTAILFK